MTFQEHLQVGKVAEGLIAAWLMSRGNAIMPAYEIEKSVGKGPQLFCCDAQHVAPDILVFSSQGICWIEAKHKSHFTWHRRSSRWTTGIDMRHYLDYFKVEKSTNLPVWLMFYHRESSPSQEDLSHGCPSECPTGLFGGRLIDLIAVENHRAPPHDLTRVGMVGHGRSGMVYWSDSALKLLATCAQVEAAADSMRRAAA